MQILSLKFDDFNTDWHLTETFFDSLNLLVGLSGVGKTRILKALGLIRKVATKSNYELDGIEWKICFFHQEQQYQWELKSELIKQSSDNLFKNINGNEEEGKTKIIYEKLSNITINNKVIAERSRDSFEWANGKNAPKFKRSESMVTLFPEEEEIALIREAFKNIIFPEMKEYSAVSFIDRSGSERHDLDTLKLRKKHGKAINFKEFKKDSIGLPMPVKGFFFQNFFKSAFKEFKESFIGIFPFVIDIKIFHKRFVNETELFVGIKEKGSNNWIYQDQISSGMFRTLTHLIEVYLAPDGTVILVDEFENSLGINCMPGITDIILNHDSQLQYIITSHHPYIIEGIPWKKWKLVCRHNRQVKVINSIDIPQLNTGSSLDKFTQLINLSEYEQGII